MTRILVTGSTQGLGRATPEVFGRGDQVVVQAHGRRPADIALPG